MSARRSSARRQASPPKQQVRSRGLLVVTLLLVGAFAISLAYIKQNAPTQSVSQGQEAVIPRNTLDIGNASPAVATPQATPSVLQSIKPKYDFYNELPKRQLVIGKDEINRREKRELKPPPLQAETTKKTEATNTNPTQVNSTRVNSNQATARASEAPTVAQTTQAQGKPKTVEMPKIELISRQGRSANSTPKTTTASTQTANTVTGGSWIIQAGAYSTFDDADQVRAKLAIMGIRARVEAGVSNNKQIHRVRIGPLLSKDVANTLNQRLSDNKIPSLLIKSN